jgi:hypothetical protein
MACRTGPLRAGRSLVMGVPLRLGLPLVGNDDHPNQREDGRRFKEVCEGPLYEWTFGRIIILFRVERYKM